MGSERVIETVTVKAKTDAVKVAPGETKTPRDWAVIKGHYFLANPLIPQVQSHARLEYAVADQLHGWTQHEHHFADRPFLLSESDYDAAVTAALNHPNTPAHSAALPPKA